MWTPLATLEQCFPLVESSSVGTIFDLDRPGISFGGDGGPYPTPTCRGASRRAFSARLSPAEEGLCGMVVLEWPTPERSCGTGLHRLLKTDNTNRGKETPFFGSQGPLFFDTSSPKT